jgi:hypothetical protein
VNVININVVTRSKIIEDQVFQERKPRKNKSIADLEKEEKLKKDNGKDNSTATKSTSY